MKKMIIIYIFVSLFNNTLYAHNKSFTLNIPAGQLQPSFQDVVEQPFVRAGFFIMAKEIWKDAPGYAGKYLISTKGRVKSIQRTGTTPKGGQFIRRTRLMKLQKHSGYYHVHLCLNGKYKSWRVHRLVALAFIDNPQNKPFINHINSKRHDNRLENLEWCTQSENMCHARDTGRVPVRVASDRPNSTLTIKQATEIKLLIKQGIMPTPISKLTGVRVEIIYNIKAGYSWKHITV